jgi:predicted 2-oxoglutarate/Fe(II)-dependent dioxygenase YbiX/peroxiredoxin
MNAPTEQPLPARPLLGRGEAAPWFHAPALSGSPNYAFDTVAGRHVLMLLFGSAALPQAAEALATALRHRALFDDVDACFFGITADPTDAAKNRIAQELPGIRFFLDYERRVSALYGAVEGDAYRPHWLLLDPALRVLGRFGLEQGEQAIAALQAAVAAPAEVNWAPVLRVPRVLEPELCAELVRRYEANGGEPSGFMREVRGKTVLRLDPAHKQRRDWTIDDRKLIQSILNRLNGRLSIPIQRAFQFRPTRIERHLVACYEAGAGHFRPHRDNTTKGTAHRRFAVTINLNENYEGGDLRFPEYGDRTYRAPVGGAIVFSCSMLHEATPVTSGRRFAYLPFLYDEEAARVREANNPHLGEGVGAYKMAKPGDAKG